MYGISFFAWKMPETATVTSKSMVNIPAKIRHKYGFKQGSKVVFVESEQGVMLLPIPPISELFGIDRRQKNLLLEAIRELEREHRQEDQK